MKKLFAASLGLMMLCAVSAFAAQEITIKGKGVCAKCTLKETDKCQNAIQVEKDGQKTIYYLVENDKSKAAHKSYFCHGPTDNVTVTGTCEKKDGKLWVTATKIEGKE
jgi:hypothetical protein